MTAPPPTFGPWSFALESAEAEAAAARFGLRLALAGGLTARHLAPLAAFVLIVAFAAILTLTGFVGRRAGEATLILAAAAFMIQRLATRLRMRRARRDGQAAIERLRADGTMSIAADDLGLTLQTEGAARRLDFGQCIEAENAGGLVYFWPREGAPLVLPARALADPAEADRLVAFTRARMRAATT